MYANLISRGNLWKNVISRIQFNSILRTRGYGRYYDEDAKSDLFNYFVRHSFSEQTVKEILNEAKKFAIMSNDRFTQFSDVKDIILAGNYSIDLSLFNILCNIKTDDHCVADNTTK